MFVDTNFLPNLLDEMTEIILRGKNSAMTIEEIIQNEIGEWVSSEKLKWMKIGERYYRNQTDILERQRTAINEHGNKEPVANLANNKLVNAFTRKLVDQKVGYLLGKPITIQTNNDKYADELNKFFDREMFRWIKSLGKEAINKGIAWLHVYYDEDGKLCTKKMRSEEIIPLWADEAHTVLDAVIRVYNVVVFEGKNKRTVRKVEWWDTNGVRRYVFDGTGLVEDIEAGGHGTHFTLVKGNEQVGMNWERVPYVAFKYNEEEQPLIQLIKSLVDDYDKQKSDNANNLEDLPNSIYVVKNFSGTTAAEFRRNIATYRTAFVEGDGGVEPINLQFNVEAWKAHMEQARKDIYEFGRGVDTQGLKLGNAPSGIALRFLYSDLDLDANIMETEFQASLEQLRWFIDVHLYNTTGVDYSEEKVEFIFNRDMPIEEDAIIASIKNSVGILSQETLIAQHPWVNDVQMELERLQKERGERPETYGGLPLEDQDDDGEDE